MTKPQLWCVKNTFLNWQIRCLWREVPWTLTSSINPVYNYHIHYEWWSNEQKRDPSCNTDLAVGGRGGASEHKYVSLRASRVVCLPSDQSQTSFEKPFGECISHNGSLFERRPRTNEVISFSWAASRIVSHSLPTHTLHILLRFVCHHATHHAGAPWLNVAPIRQMARAVALSRKKMGDVLFFLSRFFFFRRVASNSTGVNRDGRWLTITFFFFILIIIIRDATISKCRGTIIKPSPREDIYSNVKLNDNNLLKFYVQKKQ